MFFYNQPIFTSGSGGTFSEFTLNNKTYRVHKFTANESLIFAYPGTIEYLIVGGGGGGGSGFEGVVDGQVGTYTGNGGNGGQIRTGSIDIQPGSYTVVVGAYSSGAGNASSVFNVTASGGAFNGSSRFEFNGIGASGGIHGIESSIDGTARYYAGGGGRGGGHAGGLGGGGAGGLGWHGNPGVANTGGGGGGGQRERWGGSSYSKSGGAGASGIVIVRYQIA
jgi:hypothetical protein